MNSAFACEAACEGLDIEGDISSLTFEELTNPDIVCPVIFNPFCVVYSCCPQCETEARALFDCLIVDIVSDGVLCDGIVTADDYCASIPVVDSTSEPDAGIETTAPSSGVTSDPCADETLASQQCVSKCQVACASALLVEPDLSSLTLEELGNPEVLCPTVFQVWCTFHECCPECQSETQAIVDCLIVYSAGEGLNCDAVLTEGGCSIGATGTDGSDTSGSDGSDSSGTDGSDTSGTDGSDAGGTDGDATDGTGTEEEADAEDDKDATDGTGSTESTEATNGSGAAVTAFATRWWPFLGGLLLSVGYSF